MNTVEITETDIKQALDRPDDFWYYGDLDLFVTWSLGPVIRHRDSKILENSNADVLLRELENRKDFDGEWKIVCCDHWAVGWVEHLAFRAIDNNGPTEIFKFLKEWFDGLSEYPIADESDYSEKQYEATLSNISLSYEFEDDYNLEEGWQGKVFNWLWDNNQNALEDCDGDGGFPSEKDVKEALDGLGLAKVV